MEEIKRIDGDIEAPDNRYMRNQALEALAEINRKREGKQFEVVKVSDKTWVEREVK